MDKFQNKYRIESARWQQWNYANAGAYFITICTKNRQHHFGEIWDGIMHLTDMGLLVQSEWIKTPALRSDMNIQLGAFVVMPNHFHGIIIIGDNEFNTYDNMDKHCDDGTHCNDGMHCNVETHCNASLQRHQNQFGTQRKNLASIIRGFKSTVKKQSFTINPQFEWQARFHDRVIRNQREFLNIEKYIQNNPKSWKEDCFYKSKNT